MCWKAAGKESNSDALSMWHRWRQRYRASFLCCWCLAPLVLFFPSFSIGFRQKVFFWRTKVVLLAAMITRSRSMAEGTICSPAAELWTVKTHLIHLLRFVSNRFWSGEAVLCRNVGFTTTTRVAGFLTAQTPWWPCLHLNIFYTVWSIQLFS